MAGALLMAAGAAAILAGAVTLGMWVYATKTYIYPHSAMPDLHQGFLTVSNAPFWIAGGAGTSILGFFVR